MRTLLAFILLLLSTRLTPAATEKEFAARVFGGSENLAVVTKARKVTACVLTHDGQPDRPDTWNIRKLFNPNTYKAGPRVDVSDAQVEQLRAVLLDRTLNDVGAPKGCVPIYHVRFTFASGKASVDVNLCLQCDILTVCRSGKRAGGESFDRAHGKLLDLCRALFPEDEALRELAQDR